MESFLKYLESHDLKRVDSSSGGLITLDDASTFFLHVAINTPKIDLNVVSRESAATLIVVNSGESAELNISVAEGARFNILEVLYEGAKESVLIDQSRDSFVNYTVLELATADLNCIVNLNGRGADTEVNMLQLPSSEEHANISLKIAHNSADCTSRSTSKCAAAGASIGEFHGLVYVAEGAQRTSSQQNSRNVALSADAKIIAEPQLEIYADDVKCTHGATVGQMNKEAIYYMRQRGLSEEQARKLQLDGFVSEITNSCGVESLREALSEMVREHLHNM
ncbi:MAG: SufD family Fe-S cluster assembly protein [Rikenellaceae bacterium]